VFERPPLCRYSRALVPVQVGPAMTLYIRFTAHIDAATAAT
jgi:hypothetical protein